MTVFRFEATDLRFGEFDLGGVLYHANYFHVYETVREAFLSAGPMSYPTLVNLKCHLAVVESRQRFLKAIRYGEDFQVDLSCESVKKASVDIQYQFSRNGEELHRGLTSLVFIRAEHSAFSIEPLPAALKKYFESYVSPALF